MPSLDLGFLLLTFDFNVRYIADLITRGKVESQNTLSQTRKRNPVSKICKVKLKIKNQKFNHDNSKWDSDQVLHNKDLIE